jgi:hypothetical protein
MGRLLFIGFLIAHGLIHAAIWASPKPPAGDAPFDVSHSWALGDRRTLAMLLALVAGAAFVVAGGALLGHLAWWRPLTVGASGLSLLLMAAFFNPWLLMGVGLDAGLIAGVVWFDWPSRALLGA